MLASTHIVSIQICSIKSEINADEQDPKEI